MTSACCTAVLFASVVWRISDSYVIQEHGCNAAQVIEGGTGVVEFFLRKAINMSSDDLFANLRRGSDSALTAPTTPHGDAGGTIDDVVLIAVVAGSVGTVAVILVVIICVCCVRKVRRSKKKRKKDVTFYREKEQTFTLMPVPAHKKRSEKAADRLLPLNTPSTASEVMGKSSPRIEANHTPEQDESKRRNGGTSEVESIDNNNYKSTASPPVPAAKRNSLKQKDLACQQWYYRNSTSEQAEKCLLAAGNREGTFLVIDSNGKPGKYILKVKLYGEVKTRFVFVGQLGFWIESNSHFATVTDLIDYYCENAGCLPAKLSVPCSRTS